MLDQAFHCVDVQDLAIDEADFLQSIIARGVLAEVAADGDAVCAVLEGQHQVVAVAIEQDVIRADAAAELDGIDLVGVAVVVLNGVLAPAAVEAVYIVAGFAIQVVVAQTADEGIVASATVEYVVAFVALEEIIAGIAVE
ncbi:hypothetical protein X778_13620 [Pseudomonas aeruginosa VRFPA07]|nr:hypothetical protein X778_13620 [Pseudomonas aeruginosa VRFPA07]